MIMNILQADNRAGNGRYERKFAVSGLTQPEIESVIRHHPALFSEIFCERYVNNIYFDSFDMNNYHDNRAGIKDRIKIRIRWYGERFDAVEKPVLELKIKKGLLGKKISFPLHSRLTNGTIDAAALSGMFQESALPEYLKLELKSVNPVLLNRYRRKYFLSADRDFRITVDAALEYYKIIPHYASFLNRYEDRLTTIVELKYDSAQDHRAGRISNFFPFRVTRSSKYGAGIEKLWFS